MKWNDPQKWKARQDLGNLDRSNGEMLDQLSDMQVPTKVLGSDIRVLVHSCTMVTANVPETKQATIPSLIKINHYFLKRA